MRRSSGRADRFVGPDLPRRLAAVPQIVEIDFVPKGVHAQPETVVAVRGQLAVRRQPVERCQLEDGVVVVDVVENRRTGDKESAVDPTAAALRLLRETGL